MSHHTRTILHHTRALHRSLYPVLAALCLVQRGPDPARRLGARAGLEDRPPEVPQLGAG